MSPGGGVRTPPSGRRGRIRAAVEPLYHEGHRRLQDRFDARRPNARRHIAFGHGEHFCPGASLARAEARVSFERLLARLDHIQLVDPSALSYAETFIIRGLNKRKRVGGCTEICGTPLFIGLVVKQ